VLFTGQYEHSIDSKQRVAIPADIRARWNEDEDGGAWYAVPWRGGIIRLYTERDFARRAQTGFLSLTPDEDEAELQATLFGLTARLEMDSAGRVRLPEEMLTLTGLPTDVVLVGAGDRLEIRARGAWRDSKRGRLEQLPELVERISARRERGSR
jgi:MraZ protein